MSRRTDKFFPIISPVGTIPTKTFSTTSALHAFKDFEFSELYTNAPL